MGASLVRIHRVQMRLVHVLQLVDAVHEEVALAHVGRHVLRALAIAGHLLGEHRVQVRHLKVGRETRNAIRVILRNICGESATLREEA